MATKVVMEALSPTMEEGRLVKWNTAEGATVKSGDVLAEVETDKAVMELVARADGVLRKRLVAENTTVPVGALLAIIAAPDEDIAALVGAAGTSVAATASVPTATGATPAAAPPAPAAKAVPALASPASVAPVVPVAPVAPVAPTAPPPPAAAANGDPARSSPLARRLAAERGLDLGGVTGSGPGGRIIKRDIEAAIAGGARPAAGGAVAAAPRPTPSVAGFTDVPLTQIRKTIARRLAESIGPIPTFYLTAEFDLSKVTELRAAMADFGDAYKVSVNDVILKATATALAQHPEVNAHWLGDRIRQFDRVHLGMAVATDDGLIVPVIFDAHTKRMSEISREAKELATRARERKLKPEEFTGSTFSVSNLGMFGIDQFTAIINPPECGILAIGAATDQVVLHDGAVTTRKVLRVTMSCDHRAVDGAVGAKFLQTLRRMLENPLMLVY